jgi:lysophospholipase L1-like esterase
MIEDNMTSMVELAKVNDIKVILCSVLPVYEYPWKRGFRPADKIVTLNKWIKNYAEKNKMFYLDYYSSLVDIRKGLKTKYTKDGVHPNEAGYKVMIPLTEQAIAKALITE